MNRFARQKTTRPALLLAGRAECTDRLDRTKSFVPAAGEAEMRQHLGVWGRWPQRESRGQSPLVHAAKARVQGRALPLSAQDAAPARAAPCRCPRRALPARAGVQRAEPSG